MFGKVKRGEKIPVKWENGVGEVSWTQINLDGSFIEIEVKKEHYGGGYSATANATDVSLFYCEEMPSMDKAKKMALSTLQTKLMALTAHIDQVLKGKALIDAPME